MMREFLVGHGEVREGFAVFQHGVEPGHVLSNELPFEDEGCLRCLGDDAFDVVCSSDKFGNHVPVWIGCKVGAYTLVETGGFSDVQHPALFCFEQIDARFVWKVGRSQIHGHASSTLALTQKGNPVVCDMHAWG